MKKLVTLVPSGSLGFTGPFDEKTFWDAVRTINPDVIAIDGGSADCGPLFLGAGVPFQSWKPVEQDIRNMLKASREKEIPLIIGNALGGAPNVTVDQTVELTKKIAKEEKHKDFRIAVIYSDVSKDYLKNKLADGKIKRDFGFSLDRKLTPEIIDRCNAIVAMMGVEPYVKALEAGADVVITGRSTDPAIMAALPIKEGFDQGLAWHYGKMLECGSACLAGGVRVTVVGTIKEDCFELTGILGHRATIKSVTRHMLFEREDPYYHLEPGGILDMSETKYEQINERTVRISSSKWINRPYTVKLEGTEPVGYRVVAFWGNRDPVLIEHVDEVLDDLKKKLKESYVGVDFETIFHIYGKNAIMEEMEPVKVKPHEIGIFMEVICQNSPEMAADIARTAQATFQHIRGGRSTHTGECCSPCSFDVYTPTFARGVGYNWSVYDLLNLEDPCEPFEMKILEV